MHELLTTTAAVPERIVCLTEESVELLYLLGEQHRIVGVSGFAVRPKEVRQKPRVSTFLDANFDKLLALKPDLVLGFSDLQKDIAQELVGRGVNVAIFNQRSVGEVLQVMQVIGGMVGRHADTQVLVDGWRRRLDALAEGAARRQRRPKVYFEEWADPNISAIEWVSDLVTLAGGDDVFREKASGKAASERFVDDDAILQADPDVIVASWCGKEAKRARFIDDDVVAKTTAVQRDQLYEIPSPLILQPGPAALTAGVDCLVTILDAVVDETPVGQARPGCLRRVDTAA